MASNKTDDADYGDYTDNINDNLMQVLKSMGSDNLESSHYLNEMKMSYSVAYMVAIILCVIFNFTVIAISFRKYKSFQSVGIWHWIMALAVTHLVSSISLVFQFLYAYNDFKWLYKTTSCKMSSYISYGSMFFTATMLSLWSVHLAFANRVCKCKGCNIILISLAWTVAAVLACPSLFSREVRNLQCIDDFDFDDSSTTSDGTKRLKAAVIARFIFGLLVPALSLFIICCVVSARKKVKTRNILCALKIAYFVCWGPQICLTMIQVNASDGLNANVAKYGLPGATILATTHCFISPLVFLLLGCCNKMDFIEHTDDNGGMLENMPMRKCQA